jgi:hypothetical protein
VTVPDQATVSADDIRAVAAVFTLAVHCCGPAAMQVTGFQAATEACERMVAACGQPQMPEDPVAAGRTLAITVHEQMADYMGAGFDRGEAFELAKMHALLALNMGFARVTRGS